MKKYFNLIIIAALTAISLTAFAAKENTLIKIQTSMGDIVVELDEKNAPETSANFKTYVAEGFYDGTVFHRIIDNFMIQGGGMTADLKPKKNEHAPIKNEADNGLKNDVYTIAMARTSDPHSATSQFFINVKDNPSLDHTAKSFGGWGYCVFGKVVSGQDVVDKIKAVPTGSVGPYQDVPKEPVIIEKVSVVE